MINENQDEEIKMEIGLSEKLRIMDKHLEKLTNVAISNQRAIVLLQEQNLSLKRRLDQVKNEVTTKTSSPPHKIDLAGNSISLLDCVRNKSRREMLWTPSELALHLFEWC